MEWAGIRHMETGFLFYADDLICPAYAWVDGSQAIIILVIEPARTRVDSFGRPDLLAISILSRPCAGGLFWR